MPAQVRAADSRVPAFWNALGLPGLVDAHVHFMPERLLHRVWSYFDEAGPLVGRRWPIAYRLAEADRLGYLRDLGVRAFPSLLYAHKPGMAASLNAWAARFAAGHPDVLHTATFFAEPSAAADVAAALDAGARVFKVHLQVGGFDPRADVLRDAWGALAEAGVPVVVHAGHGPVAAAWTGAGPIGEVLAAHPRLQAVLAHMGAPDYAAFVELARRHPASYLDTTMVGTPFFERDAPLPRELRPALADLGDRVLLGTDFPNIPYAYAAQLDALAAWDLGDDWLRRVCHDNAAALFGLAAKE